MKNEYINSQDEKIEIKLVIDGPFEGEHVLCIHDDPDVSDTIAYHLLDKGTVKWLTNCLTDSGFLHHKKSSTS